MTQDNESALVSKVNVVDGASLRFTETGSMQTDSWEIEWEATPAPAERALPPGPVTSASATRPAAEAGPPEAQPKPSYRPPVEEPEPSLPPGAYRPPPPEVLEALAAPAEPQPAPPPPPPSELDFSWADDAGDVPPPPVQPPPSMGPWEGETAGAAPPPPKGHPIGDEGAESMPVVFQGLHPDALHRTIGYFRVFDLPPGQVLINAGERHSALVMILRGQLEAFRGAEKRRAGSGEVLGLTTLFGSGRWPATLRTSSVCRLMVLELREYQQLRQEGSRVALAIEEYALQTLLAGLTRTSEELAKHLDPRPMNDLIPAKSFFSRCAAAFGAGGITDHRVDAASALAASQLFRNAGAAHLQELGTRFEGLRADPGEFLIQQGDTSTHMFLVVDGAVDVLRSGKGDKAVKTATLGPGALFGEGSMLGTSPSAASYLAKQRTVLLELDKVSWAELAPRREPLGSILRLAVLRSLCLQLVGVSGQLLQLSTGGALRPADTHDRFLSILPAARR